MGWEQVSAVLWKERELLEVLLFKLEEEHLVLASGRTRWLAHATAEVEAVLERIREAELVRAVEVQGLAADLGLPGEPSLTQLVDVAPAPWDEIVRGHREAFLQLTSEITAVAQGNRDHLVRAARATQEALLDLAHAGSAPVETYGRDGARASGRRAHLVDEAL